MWAKFKCAYKSKTVWFAILIGTLSVLQGFVFYLPIDPRWQALIGVFVAIVCILLRFVTDKPLNDL